MTTKKDSQADRERGSGEDLDRQKKSDEEQKDQRRKPGDAGDESTSDAKHPGSRGPAEPRRGTTESK